MVSVVFHQLGSPAIQTTDNSMLCSMVMFLLIILLCVGSLKVLFLALYFSSYTLIYLSFIVFADDTNIFLRYKDLATLARMVNQELSHVSSWFNANKLTVHPDKSKFIIFHPRRKQSVKDSGNSTFLQKVNSAN